MRTKQCAIRRVANNNSDEEDETSATLTIIPQSPESGPPSHSHTPAPPTATIINGQGQQQLEDGTVVVQPEAAAETGDNQVGCFEQASSGARCAAPGIYDTIKCTACGKRVNPYNGTMEVHPLLKVLVCQKCYKFYASGHFDSDEQGKENQCRWCGEGGSLICCDNCEHSFCRTCIKRNLGRSALQDIESLPDESVWLCYACDQGSLRHLQEEATIVIKAVKEHFQEVSKRSEKQKVAQAKKAVAAPASTLASALPSQLQPLPLPQLQQIRPATVPVLVAAATPAIAYSSVRGGVGLPNSATIAGMQLDLSSVPKATTRLPPAAAVHQPLQSHRQMVQQQNQHILQQSRQQLQQLQQLQLQQQQQRRQQQTATAAPAVAGQASVTQRTELWYKQNVRIENILADIESVDVRSIGTALNATVSLLQGMMRQYSRFMQDLNVALTNADKSQIVSRFKSAYRMHLFLRLGKLRSLIAEEDKHMMRKGSKAVARVGLGAASTNAGAGSSIIDLTGPSAASASRPVHQPGLYIPQAKPAPQPLIQSAVPSVSRYQLQHVHVAQQSQRHPQRQAPRPNLDRTPVVLPEVVVLSDDDDDEENNNCGNGNAGDVGGVGSVIYGKEDQQSESSEVPASIAATATGSGGGGKPAAILELLEARRQREKCARKLQQPRKIPAASADAPAEASAEASPEAPVETLDVADEPAVTGSSDCNGTGEEVLPSSPSERVGPAKRRASADGDGDGPMDSGGDGDWSDSAPPSEKRPRHQLLELNAEPSQDVVSTPAAAVEASTATA